MITTIRDTERDTYAEMWEHERYGEYCPGVDALPLFLDMAAMLPREAVLDAGCGSGRSMVALQDRGFVVTGCDLVDARVPEAQPMPFVEACLWAHRIDLGRYDWVYCTDVLEHVPPEFTMLVVSNLLAMARRGVLIQVSLVPDRCGSLIGRPLHLSIFPFTWWRDHLRELGHLVECRDLINSAVFYLRPA